MTTFSQLVDAMVLETRMPALTVEICSYVNQTLRELHSEPKNNNPIFYPENRLEAQLVATSDDTLTWSIPEPANFQAMEAVRYDYWMDDEGNPIFAKHQKPGLALSREPYAYYRLAGGFAFKGFGGIGAIITLSYFQFPRSLKYELPDCRPAEYFAESGWQLNEKQPQWWESECLREEAKTLTSNWLLLRWPETVKEGVRAKIYKRLGDEARSRQCYSAFTQSRQTVFVSESAILGSIY